MRNINQSMFSKHLIWNEIVTSSNRIIKCPDLLFYRLSPIFIFQIIFILGQTLQLWNINCILIRSFPRVSLCTKKHIRDLDKRVGPVMHTSFAGHPTTLNELDSHERTQRKCDAWIHMHCLTTRESTHTNLQLLSSWVNLCLLQQQLSAFFPDSVSIRISTKFLKY